MDEKDLIQRLINRDRRAPTDFYSRYSIRLLHYIRRKVGNEADVQEIAQDTLFAFLEDLRDFTGRCSINTYLCAIANNKIVDFYRRRKIKKIVFSQLPPSLEAWISEIVDPQKTFDESLTAQKISQVLNRLAPHYRRLIRLKYIEGLSVSEIAQKLACTFKAAESGLFRARRAFVQLYQTE